MDGIDIAERNDQRPIREHLDPKGGAAQLDGSPLLLHRAHGFDRQAQQGQGYIRAFIRSRYTRGGSAARRNGGGGLQERHAFYRQRLPLLQHKGIRQFCPQGKQQPRRQNAASRQQGRHTAQIS